MSRRRIAKLALIGTGGLASYLGYRFISDQTVVSDLFKFFFSNFILHHLNSNFFFAYFKIIGQQINRIAKW